MISTAPFPWDRDNWECGRSAIHQLGGLTGELPAEERAAFLEMRAHELRGRELTAGDAASRNAHGAHSSNTAG